MDCLAHAFTVTAIFGATSWAFPPIQDKCIHYYVILKGITLGENFREKALTDTSQFVSDYFSGR